MLTSQCPGKDLIKTQAKPDQKKLFFAHMNLVILNYMDNSYSKCKIEEICT